MKQFINIWRHWSLEHFDWEWYVENMKMKYNLNTLDSLPKSYIQWRGRMFSIQNQGRRKMILKQPWTQNFIIILLLPFLTWTETPQLNSNFKRDVLRFNIFSLFFFFLLFSFFLFFFFLFSFFFFSSSNLSPHSKKKNLCQIIPFLES